MFQMLKEKLQEKFPTQVVKYSCQVAGVDASTGREKVGLNIFPSQTNLRDLLNCYRSL